ncbi:LANO_0H24696g1_1 [Lachancea nothofagi CBS 11611]|uniref:LANO_0H24696g1_1 n=1 Tax=Lachancea nothofagi CBS 11611 TaxID=1266666 RepID=A0A1G4KNV8_9SACH|nr:LANO_0H24696g1_1 [Lachancea nothofagi CBS 11611]
MGSCRFSAREFRQENTPRISSLRRILLELKTLKMEDVDAEFGPVRKSLQKVDSDRIVQDASVDHEQQAFLRKIRLVTGDKALSKSHSLQPDNSRNTQEEDNQKSSLTVKRSRSGSDDDTSSSHPKSAKICDPSYSQFQLHLLKQLNNSLPADSTRLPSFVHEASKEIERILKQAIIQKESHSAILVGPRSHYKTAVINHHISLLNRRFGQQFVTLRLNGLIHTEQAAINSIAYQLESRLQKLHGNRGSDFQISAGSLTEVFEKILRLIDTTTVQNTSASTTSRDEKISVVFIFDEIDTFAGPLRQTLLYNLFDMVEHARVPVCILGCTTKMNVVEHLEKRVNSRFSQRVIYMPVVKTLKSFLRAVEEQLTVDIPNECAVQWNRNLKNNLQNETSGFFKLVRNNYETFRSIVQLKNSLYGLLAKERSLEAVIDGINTCKSIYAYNQNQLENSLSAKVKSLSDLELAMVIAAGRVSLKTGDNVNFNLTYAEYSDMVKETNKRMPIIPQATGTSLMLESTLRVWNKQDAKNVWENLTDLDFLAEKGSIGLRISALAAFQASNYHTTGTIIPFDLRTYQMQINLQELRRTVPKSSIYYSWTQL